MDPALAFSQGLQNGVGAGLQIMAQRQQKQEFGQQQQLSMAQMAQQKSEFDAMQSLRQQQFGLDSQKTMADIGMVQAQTQIATAQAKIQQFQATQQPVLYAASTAAQGILSNMNDISTFNSEAPKVLAADPVASKLPPEQQAQLVANRYNQLASTNAGNTATALQGYNKTVLSTAAEAGVDPNDHLTASPDGSKTYDFAGMAQNAIGNIMDRQKAMLAAQLDNQMQLEGMRGQVQKDVATIRSSLPYQTKFDDVEFGSIQKNISNLQTQLAKPGIDKGTMQTLKSQLLQQSGRLQDIINRHSGGGGGAVNASGGNMSNGMGFANPTGSVTPSDYISAVVGSKSQPAGQ